MKHRVLWGFGPAPGRAPDRKGLSRVGGLSGRTTRGRATEIEGCVPKVPQTCRNVRKRAETCPRRVGSVVYTTLPHAPFPAFAAWCADMRTRNRAAPDLGGIAAPGGHRLPASWATGPTWRLCWPSGPGWPCCPTWPGTAPRVARVRQRAAFCRALAASAGAPAPAFAVSSGMLLGTESQIGEGTAMGANAASR